MSKLDNDVCTIVFNALSDGIIIVDNKNNFFQANAAANHIINTVFPEELVLSYDDFKNLFAISDCQDSTFSDSKIVSHNSKSISIHKKKFQVNENLIILITLRDITGQKKQLETIDRQLFDMLWKIRSKITPVHNAINLLFNYQSDMTLNENRMLLQNSDSELYFLTRSLDNFRDLFQLFTNSITATFSYTHFTAYSCIEKVKAKLNYITKSINKNFILQNNVPIDLSVYTDHTRLSRIFKSLFLNSCIYSVSPVTISVYGELVDSMVKLVITDTGFGIPEEDQIHLFNYQFRGRNAQKVDYNGLGCELYLCRTIITQLGGSITFESKDGHGTTFELHIPLKEHQRECT